MGKIKRIYAKRSELKKDALWLYEQSRDVRLYTVIFFCISLVSMLFSLASPVASKFVVDAAIGEEKNFRFEYALIMLGTTVVSIILSALSNIFSSYVNEKFAFNVRARMFDRTQRGRWLAISKFHSGDMLARLTSDVDNIASSIISFLPNILVTLIRLAVVLVILLTTDPVLALIGLIVGPIGAILALVFKNPFQRYQKLIRQSQSEYYTFFQESLGNLDVIKVFELEDDNNVFFESFREKRMKNVMKSAKLSNLMSSTMRFVYGAGYVVAFCWCAGQLGTNPAYTYGTMTLFLSLVSQLQGSVRGLGDIIPSFYSVLISAERVREITEQNPEVKLATDDMPEKVGLSVKNVTFSYGEGTVLDDVSVDIAPCERVGIIGPSGMGKTTLIRLMLALTEPNKGSVEFTKDNGETECASPTSRRFISYVPQGNTLMTGTVRDNLRVGDPDVDDAKMWEALEKADAADFIRKDPRGLDMPIQENSGGLSAGQAQRICIARAFIRNRPVLIFDEATSALDEATERRVFEALSGDNERTYFIITHRSSMLKYCTSVLEVTYDGKLIYRKNNE